MNFILGKLANRQFVLNRFAMIQAFKKAGYKIRCSKNGTTGSIKNFAPRAPGSNPYTNTFAFPAY